MTGPTMQFDLAGAAIWLRAAESAVHAKAIDLASYANLALDLRDLLELVLEGREDARTLASFIIGVSTGRLPIAVDQVGIASPEKPN